MINDYKVISMADDQQPIPKSVNDASGAPIKEQRADSTSGEENYGSTKRQTEDPSSPDNKQSAKR